MSSILRSLVIPSTKQDEFGGKNNWEINELYTKQLEGIKLFSILFLAKALQCGFDSGQDLGITLRELHLLLLSSLVSVNFCSTTLGVYLFPYMMYT